MTLRVAPALVALALLGGAQAAPVRTPVIESFAPAWSPDGKRIAFHSNLITLFNDSEGLDIFVMDADGKRRRYVTSNTLGDQLPAWSPDSRRLAFWSARFGGGIVVANADRSGSPRFVATASLARPSWSPDGTRLAYTGFRADGVYVIDLRGGKPVRLADGSRPAWSPDGRRLALLRDRALFVIGGDGSGARRVAAPAFQLAWSPDGSRIALVTLRGGEFELDVDGVDGGGRVTVARAVDGSSGPAWSPDGSRIAFAGTHGLFVADAAGGDPARLTRSRYGDAYPDWSPDGRRIAFVRELRGLRTAIYTVRTDGSGLRALTTVDPRRR